MGFDEEYQSFLNHHLQLRKGESHRRLEEGLGHGELTFLKNVWWPLFQHFDYLHPEYEVDDFKDGKRYLDFAYIRPGGRICFEVDGYGSHHKNATRWQFVDHLDRQNQLTIDGWSIIRFAYDQITDQPRRCQQITQQIISRLLGNELNQNQLSYIEKEIIRFALRKGEAITPKDVSKLLNRNTKLTRKILKDLVAKRMLCPAAGKLRIRSYKLDERAKSPFL